MDAFFVDDSRQRRSSREGMGSLVAIGGIYVPEASIKPLEAALEATCEEFGFPPGQEFKWSPGRRLWMRRNLVEERRAEFFRRVFEAARGFGVQVIVVVEDEDQPRATASATAEEDAVQLFLERADNHLRGQGRMGVVVADRPGGRLRDEERFLARCIETLREGTRFVHFGQIALVITTPSHLHRLMQLADVVTGCTTSYVSGEGDHAPPVFDSLRPMFRSDLGRIGGIGLKIQPDHRYANLYHWLLGDPYLVRYPDGLSLPDALRPYPASPDRF